MKGRSGTREGEKLAAHPCGEGGKRRRFFYVSRNSEFRGDGKNVSAVGKIVT